MKKQVYGGLMVTLILACRLVWAEQAMSFNRQVIAVPAPGPVKIDGNTEDWDLSAGVWSYNDPTLVGKFSVWTHLMWDQQGVYLLARYADHSPMQNAVMGKNFGDSWKADCFQARVIFDDGTPREHQMHVNMFYATPEDRPYMIVHHGGMRSKPPYDATGAARPDLDQKLGVTMDAAGGKIAFQRWPDGQGYNLEAFWPWKYCRLDGQPLQAGDQFVFGIEAMWGNGDGTALSQRLADVIQNEKVNRIFMFRARDGWGRAVLSDKGRLDITAQQLAQHASRLKQFVDYETYGSIPIAYTLPENRDVTIAIDDATGRRVRNLYGQYPRKKGTVQDFWDGLDDRGQRVPAGTYTAIVVDHQPIAVKLINSLFNAATPPWPTDTGARLWGANHGHPTTACSDGEIILLGFTGVEGTTGLMRCDANGKILWTDVTDVLDVTTDGKFAYELSNQIWMKKTLVQRLDAATGKIIPFDDESRSIYTTVRDSSDRIPASSSLAHMDGKLFVLIPGETFLRLDARTGKIELQRPAGELAALTTRAGRLYGLHRDGGIHLLNAGGDNTGHFASVHGVALPLRLTISQDLARLAITDGKTNQVRIFDRAGKPVGDLGRPYEDADRPAGTFVPTDLSRPLGAAFDAQGRLWVAEASPTTRRVTLWSSQQELLRQFWGGADYGAMSGFVITSDSTRFIAHGIEFQLDPDPNPWQRPTAEKALRYHPELVDTRGFVYRRDGHDYAISLPGYNKTTGFFIAKRGADGVFRKCVTVSYGKGSAPGKAWIDRNDDGREDAAEQIQGVKGRAHYWSAGWARPDLTIITADQYIYAPQGFTPGGTPLYDFANPLRPKNAIALDLSAQGSTGTIVMDNAGNLTNGIVYATVDGRSGAYPNPYGRHDAPAARRGVLIAPFRTNGVVEDVPNLGSITALGGDRGEWFLLTTDGLYISSILQDAKSDVTRDETFVGQESFGGFIWRDEAGRVLLQLGGPSYRIMQVLNLDTCRKQRITLNVTDAQIAEGARIAAARKPASAAEPTELTVARVANLPTQPVAATLAGDAPLIAGATTVRVQEAGDQEHWWRAALAHDGKNLAIMYQVHDSSPWKNGEGRFTHAFVGGDCVDLKLDVPGRGPQRLLAAPIGGDDTVAYWRTQAEARDNPQTYAVGNNPAGASSFDIVRRCPAAQVRHDVAGNAYSVLVVVPLAELGIDLQKNPRVTGVIGVIFSDPSGTNRSLRSYWFDKRTGLVSDVPSESRLEPSRWGPITFEK